MQGVWAVGAAATRGSISYSYKNHTSSMQGLCLEKGERRKETALAGILTGLSWTLTPPPPPLWSCRTEALAGLTPPPPLPVPCALNAQEVKETALAGILTGLPCPLTPPSPLHVV